MASQTASGREPTLLTPLLPPGPPMTAAKLVDDLGLWARRSRGSRPRVLLNMVSTADGRATLAGRSGAISSPADRELFHALRTPVDAVLVGAATIRTERYGRLIRDPARRALRRERGLAEEPLACVISASLELDPSIPLLTEPESRLVVLTPTPGELPETGCQVEYIRTVAGGRLDLAAALAKLAARLDVGLVLCEGGPHVARELLAAGLLDELFLSIAPVLAGGDGRRVDTPALRILAGAELDPAVQLRLLGALENDSHLFLRYGVGRVGLRSVVSRETISSSSEAS
jgi:riboflavin biosynthesis pyrimidine reductase